MLESPDAVTPTGHTAKQVLDLIEGERSSELEWVEAAGDGVRVEVEPGGSGTTPLSIALARGEGEIRWVDSKEVTPPGPTNEIAVDCRPRIEVDAKLEFETEDGAFAELLDVVVRAEVDYDNQINSAVIQQEYDPAALMGALEIINVDPPDYEKIYHEIEVVYPLAGEDAGVPEGRVHGWAQYDQGDAVMIGVFDLARFGAVEVGE